MVTVTAKSIARLAYGYELMFRAICEIAGTSGGSTQWYTQMGIEVQKRVDPLWKVLEDSNAPKPGDCLSQHEPFAKWAEDAETALAAKDAEITRLREALTFYKDGFKFIPKRGPTGLNHSEWQPTDELLMDCGNKALDALEEKAHA